MSKTTTLPVREQAAISHRYAVRNGASEMFGIPDFLFGNGAAEDDDAARDDFEGDRSDDDDVEGGEDFSRNEWSSLALPRASTNPSGTGAQGGSDARRDADRNLLGMEGRDPRLLRAEAPMRTIADAIDFVKDAIAVQLARARAEFARPNVAIVGDNAVRVTFYTLLGDAQQRRVFLQTASDMRNWPRLRSLFGAPPYNFLRAEDGGTIRASGLVPTRRNLANENQIAASYAQFGTAQLKDEFEREYRAIPAVDATDNSPLPWHFTESASRTIHLQVRVKKRSRTAKSLLAKNAESKRLLTFPRPGEKIALQETSSLLRILRGARSASRVTHLKIEKVIPRGANAATAAVFATL